MVIAWCISLGSIHYSFIKTGKSITAEVYWNQLGNMMKNLAKKQPRLLNRDRLILLYNYGCPHTANRMQLKLLELDLETIEHPPYSSDLSLNDYYLFWNLDNLLQGKIFNSQQAFKDAFRAFIGSRSPGFYTKGKSISMPQKHTCNN